MASQTSRRGIAALLFVLVWVSCIWFSSWAMNPNNLTRMLAAVALVERGEATIDSFAPLTIDKAEFDGHFYMDKAPGVTLMALPAVALAGSITDTPSAFVPVALYDPRTEAFFQFRMTLAIAFSVAILTALGAVALLDLGTRVTGNLHAGLFGALAFALGTPVWGWSTSLFGHAPVAALLVIAAWAAWRGTEEGARRPATFAAIAGAALGWAVVIEHPSVLEGLAIALFALWRMRAWDWRRRGPALIAAIAAGIAALLPLIGYSLIAYGTIFRLGYQGVVGFDGMQQGFFGLTYPKPRVLASIIAGPYRGILWVAPVLLLIPFAAPAMLQRRNLREVAILAIAVAVIAFLYNASYVYWDGGSSTGPRHAIPAIGFLALLLAGGYALADRAVRLWMVALLVVSIAINLIIASAEITTPTNFYFPLGDFVIPERFWPGYLRTLPSTYWGWTTWSGLYLYLALAAGLGALLWRAVRKAR